MNWPPAHDRLHGLVHSIAFADYPHGPEALPRNAARGRSCRPVDISCFSLLALCRALKDLLDPDASVVTISISTTRMASENYGYMAPDQGGPGFVAGLSGQVVQPVFARAVQRRAPGLLKTSASAGIPGYVDAYLYAEQATLRKQAVETEEVANVAAFLLSPRSSGINAQRIVVDAGMSINYFDRELVRAGHAVDAKGRKTGKVYHKGTKITKKEGRCGRNED